MKWLRKKHKKRRHPVVSKKTVVLGVAIVSGLSSLAGAAYFFVYMNQPLYISPLPILKTVKGVDDVSVDQRVAGELKKNHIAYTAIDTVESSAIIVKLKDNGEVLLTSDKDISMQIASLQVILVRLTMEGKQFRKLDLRFSKPVIVFNDRKIMLDTEVSESSPASASNAAEANASPSASIEE